MREIGEKPELLAPVGRWDVLEAVIAAGADAVYLGTKRFNMRAHRKDFHFDDELLARAIDYAHGRGVKVYVTVNNMLADRELEEVESLLGLLERLGADSVIIQDLAVLETVRRLGLRIPVHASTMMNVHSAGTARRLRELGVSRIIASRDIDFKTAGLIAREAGIEVECFAHGDMCVCQSGQCYISGITMGKSGNRGECMKPCRWNWELLARNGGDKLVPVSSGHLMALKDLTVMRLIPQAVQEGIVCLKIEGRMRDAGYLGWLVELYRKAIDAYFASPGTFQLTASDLHQVFASRIRDLSTLGVGGARSSAALFDPKGQREPLFLSKGVREASLSWQQAAAPEYVVDNPRPAKGPARLAVTVANREAAQAALEAGADRIDLAWELPPWAGKGWTPPLISEVMELARARPEPAAVGLQAPRIADERGLAELGWLLERLEGPVDAILVHQLGALDLARKHRPEARLVADYSFNVLNRRSAALLAELGADAVTVSLEASFADVKDMTAEHPECFEALVHGTLTGMLLEHCLLANYAGGGGGTDFCRAPCQHTTFMLRDETGQLRRLWTDQQCRNHLTTGSDLALLGQLPVLLDCGIGVMRIEGRLYKAEELGTIVRVYRTALDRLAAGRGKDPYASQEDWEKIVQASGAGLNLGAYSQTVTQSIATNKVIRSMRAA